MDEERFSKQVVETIAKRAANICSNPDCGAITTGPAEEADRSVVIGEATHIYGARPGSARYREALSPAERGDITNAIWLCRNCHKSIDADPNRFSAELLFEWHRQHEEEISKKLGKTSGLLREKIIARQLSEFSPCSYLAQQIVIDKPECWEYKLTLELFRSKVGPLLKRWASLEKGSYTKASVLVKVEVVSDWIRCRMDEGVRLIGALAQLATVELTNSWGAPGAPGDATEILRVCDLFADFVTETIAWEEAVRFSSLPSEFSEVKKELAGTMGSFLSQLQVIVQELEAVINPDEPNRSRDVELTVTLPDGWLDRCTSAIERAWQRVAASKLS